MMKRFFPFLFVCAALLVNCASPGRIHSFQLKNGLRVYLFQHESPIASAVFHVQCGTLTGPPQLASLTNRMLLQGNEIRTGYQVFREVESMGGRLGAEETPTTSLVYVTSPKETFYECFQIFNDCLTSPTFDNTQAAAAEFQKLKNKTVKLLIPTKPMHEDDEALRSLLFAGCPLGVKSEPANSVYSQSEMRSFYRENYLPQNAVLVIAGNVDEKDILKWIQDAWSGFEKNKPNQLQVSRGHLAENPVHFQSHENKLDRIVFGFRAPLPFDSLFYETCLLRRALGSGVNSLLYQWMHQKSSSNFDYQPQAYYQYEYGYGYFSVSVEVPKSKTEYFRKALLKKLETIGEQGFSQREFEIAKRKLISDMAYLEQFTLKSAYLLSLATLQNPEQDPQFGYFDYIANLSLEDINLTARKILQDPVALIYTKN